MKALKSTQHFFFTFSNGNKCGGSCTAQPEGPNLAVWDEWAETGASSIRRRRVSFRGWLGGQ